MVKKTGLVIIGIVVLFFAFANVYLFLNKQGASYSNVSGMFVKEVPELPYGLSISLVAFIGQWVILLIIVLLAYARFMKRKKEEHIRINYEQIKKKSKWGTDLDTLYELIKLKKRLTTRMISKLFKIDKEKALEWAKILENQELVNIEYPAFNDPEVRLNEKPKEESEEKEDKEGEEKEGDKKEKGKESSKKKEDKKNKKLLRKDKKKSRKK